MFVYQPTLDNLELKKDKGTDYVLSWKPNGLLYHYCIILNLSHYITAFLHSIKLSRYKMGIKFDKDPLAVEQQLLDQHCKYLYCL